MFGILSAYLTANGLRRQLLPSPADISFGRDTLVQPDLFVADTAAFLHSGNWEDVKTLYLVIEIVSPSSATSDRTIKRQLFQKQRIPEYWVIDIEQAQLGYPPSRHTSQVECPPRRREDGPTVAADLARACRRTLRAAAAPLARRLACVAGVFAMSA